MIAELAMTKRQINVILTMDAIWQITLLALRVHIHMNGAKCT